MNSMEWDSIRIFLAVAEQGSMSAAAQVVGISQPTVSRQILALEERTGLHLFERSTSGLKLTPVGRQLLESAKDTALGAERFSRQVNGSSIEESGNVRLAVSELFGFHFLPDALAAFHRVHPLINVELIVSNDKVNLNKRDADISICQQKPEQPDLVVTYLMSRTLGFFAHESYIDDVGYPETPDDIYRAPYSVIGFDNSNMYINQAEKSGRNLSKKQFTFRTDSYQMQLNLIQAQAGVAVTIAEVAKKTAGLIEIFKDIPLPNITWWLVCHRDVQVNPRIHHLMVFLREWFQKQDEKL